MFDVLTAALWIYYIMQQELSENNVDRRQQPNSNSNCHISVCVKTSQVYVYGRRRQQQPDIRVQAN